MKRREFIVAGAFLSLAGLGGLSACEYPEVSSADISKDQAGKHWGFVIDVDKFNRDSDIARIVSTCHEAHNVPDLDNKNEEVKWVWEEAFTDSFSELDSKYLTHEFQDASVPVFCNHCEEPPCVRVCPTQATFKRQDGIVDMDYHRCIGCRFCMAACPFGARSLNFKDPLPYIGHLNPNYPTRTKGVVEKCAMCVERIDKGQIPLCAEVSNGSILFGDLNDPHSEVRQVLAHAFSIRRRQSLGTGPSVYYVLGKGEAHA